MTIQVRYTPREFRAFYRFSLFRGKYARWGETLFHAFALLMTAVFVLSLTLWVNVSLAVFSGVITAAYGLFRLTEANAPRKQRRAAPGFFTDGFEVRFEKNKFTALLNGSPSEEAKSVRYDALFKVYETRRAFYIYTAPSQTLLLDKASLPEGAEAELRALLQGKVRAGGYVVCR